MWLQSCTARFSAQIMYNCLWFGMIFCVHFATAGHEIIRHELKAGSTTIRASSPGRYDLNIICTPGLNRSFHHAFSTCSVEIRFNGTASYDIFTGCNVSDVEKQFVDKKSWLLPVFQTYRDKSRSSIPLVPVFNSTCIGVYTDSSFSLQRFDVYICPYRVIFLTIGVLLFLNANWLAKNTMLYYSSGMALTVIGSLLIIVFITSRFIPKKIGAVAFIFGGWSVVGYIYQLAFKNIDEIQRSNLAYFIGAYVVFVCLVTFAYLYWHGPPKDPRAHNLIRWTLQIIGLLTIYISIQLEEFSLPLMFCIILTKASPCNFRGWSFIFRRWSSSNVRKLLTEEEYIEQGKLETQKALRELKIFCNSPDCNKWKTVSRLKSPGRFANFVEGSKEHVLEDEVLTHEMDGGSLPDGVLVTGDMDTLSDVDSEDCVACGECGARGSAHVTSTGRAAGASLPASCQDSPELSDSDDGALMSDVSV